MRLCDKTKAHKKAPFISYIMTKYMNPIMVGVISGTHVVCPDPAVTLPHKGGFSFIKKLPFWQFFKIQIDRDDYPSAISFWT